MAERHPKFSNVLTAVQDVLKPSWHTPSPHLSWMRAVVKLASHLIDRVGMSSHDALMIAVHGYCSAAAYLLLAAGAAGSARPPARKKRRHYLTRLSLQPVYRSAWRIVYDSLDERSLLNTVGFDRRTFNHLLLRFTPEWHSRRRTYRRHAQVEDVLGLCLQWLNSTSRQKTLCQVFALPPATLSRLLRFGLQTLLVAVRCDYWSRIAWPTHDEMQHFSDVITAYEPAIKGVFGFVDGVYFRCSDPPDELTQNAYYNSWRSYCSITNVLVFSPDGCIMWARYNMPGSYHDARLARPLYTMLLDPLQTPAQFSLIADTAFPRTGEMFGRIITPPKVGELEQWREEHEVTMSPAAVVRVRQAAEWGMHTLQSVFARLGIPVAYDPPFNSSLLLLIFHLFNLRTRCVGLNQTQTVYYGPLEKL